MASGIQGVWGLMGALERNISREFTLADFKLCFILRFSENFNLEINIDRDKVSCEKWTTLGQLKKNQKMFSSKKTFEVIKYFRVFPYIED